MGSFPASLDSDEGNAIPISAPSLPPLATSVNMSSQPSDYVTDTLTHTDSILGGCDTYVEIESLAVTGLHRPVCSFARRGERLGHVAGEDRDWS